MFSKNVKVRVLIVKKSCKTELFFISLDYQGKLNVDAPNMKHRENQSKNLEQNELS